jgi:DNA ligase (NAD+)
VEVIKDTGHDARPLFAAPVRCPACGAPLVRDEEEVALRCPNRASCPAQLAGSIRHFCSRGAMDIDHLGPKLIEQLLREGLVRNVADLFTLEVDRLVPLERMEQKSAENVVNAIQVARRERTLVRLITGLGIELVGAVAAEPVAEYFGSLAAMLERSPDAVRVDLEGIHGVGPKMAESVADFLRLEANREVLRKLLDLGLGDLPVRGAAPAPTGGAAPLAGKAFCVTGTLSRPREDIHNDIRAAGGAIHTSVKKGTTYLVAGDKVGATKIAKAKALGVEVVDEAGLLALIGGAAIAAGAPPSVPQKAAPRGETLALFPDDEG